VEDVKPIIADDDVFDFEFDLSDLGALDDEAFKPLPPKVSWLPLTAAAGARLTSCSPDGLRCTRQYRFRRTDTRRRLGPGVLSTRCFKACDSRLVEYLIWSRYRSLWLLESHRAK
jgi:hypothetical protein